MKNYIGLLFLFMLLLSFSCNRFERGGKGLSYQLTEKEMLEVIQSEEYALNPEEANLLLEEKPQDYLFVDLRSPAEYLIGHLEGAVNIPVQTILEAENLEIIANPKYTTILYANDEAQAIGPWMLLRQVGFDQVKVLQGGFQYFNDYPASGSSAAAYLPEIPKVDFAAAFNAAVEQHKKEAEAAKPKPVVIPQKKIVPKPKKKKVEEEEGC